MGAWGNDKTVALVWRLLRLERLALAHAKAVDRLVTYLYQASMHRCVDERGIELQIEEIGNALDDLVDCHISLEELKERLTHHG